MLIIREFFEWARHASATQRAAGATSLVCDYLHMELSAEERVEVESVLTRLLDDPSPLVRRALAEGFASEARAPRHILTALAADQTEIAAITLGAAPFSPTELAEAALDGVAAVRLAIARRPALHRLVAEVLAERADEEALVALAGNQGADLSERAMLTMLARAGESAALREALLMREGLPAAVRDRLAEAVGAVLADWLAQTGWLPPERVGRVLLESRAKAVVSATREERGPPAAAAGLVKHLRVNGQLTPALLIRSLLGGDSLLLAAALAELADLPLARAVAQAAAPEGSGFAALYARAGLPPAILPVFVALLDEIRAQKGRPHRVRVADLASRAIESCAQAPEAERGRILTLVKRLEAEAARDEARLRSLDAG